MIYYDQLCGAFPPKLFVANVFISAIEILAICCVY